ncbi:8-oxo-dGTP diphosphatase [Microbacterium nanhaiense]|uniref:8-oxo-dGTP diphosphatase n=1 Tax=Microbacterium nanhaiense TaxID=1301026 RepID=A0ABQ2MYN1_9MICO|nr:NUDIX hydrolase [Microbacterium nanhaiense]GGO62091.1 8-oxo-dGTP diphosphatase [Microbacterium nanhaiense]
MPSQTVLAAGGVVWRRDGHGVRVLAVRRRKYRDLSFAKGKLDPGETFAEAAVREIFEETGIAGVLGAPLGAVKYRLPSGRKKHVAYWAVEATKAALAAARFTPNNEISEIVWMTLDEAREKLSYPADTDVLGRFEQLIDAGGLDTFPVVVMRHGKAGSGSTDAVRPLTPTGHEQAQAAVGPLRAFGIRRVYASTAARCQQTAAPIAAALGKSVHAEDAISQDAWERGEDDPAAIIAKRVEKAKPVVICSHGPVIPALMEALAVQTQTGYSRELREAASLSTGSFTVAHVRRGGQIVAVETHSPLDERRPPK